MPLHIYPSLRNHQVSNLATVSKLWRIHTRNRLTYCCYLVGVQEKRNQDRLLGPIREKEELPGVKGSWKTRVLIAVNVNKCELKVNMGNLMGSSL